MFRLIAWYSAADLGAALTAIANIADQSITPSGTTGYIVPNDTPKLVGGGAVMEPATALQVQFQAPSLRIRTYPTVEPFTLDASVPASPIPWNYWGRIPTDLQPQEVLQAFVNSNEAVAQYVLAMLADGPMAPEASGQKVQSVRFTSTVQAAAATWAAGAITLDQSLPVGNYKVVGLRVRGTGLVAGRLIFSNQVARPGVPAALGLGGLDAPWARFGEVSGWGQFHTTNPPQIEVIGGTAAAQVGILDLVQVDSRPGL